MNKKGVQSFLLPTYNSFFFHLFFFIFLKFLHSSQSPKWQFIDYNATATSWLTCVAIFRNEASANALNLVWAGFAARNNRTLCGLHGYDFDGIVDRLEKLESGSNCVDLASNYFVWVLVVWVEMVLLLSRSEVLFICPCMQLSVRASFCLSHCLLAC